MKYLKLANSGKISALLALMLFAGVVNAQETLPRPDTPFKGTIGRTAKDSKPDFPKEVQAPEGAPNILLIMTDDVGYGAGSPFEPASTAQRLGSEAEVERFLVNEMRGG